MERREMLAASFRGLAQALPALLTTVGTLAVILDHQAGPPRGLRAACFPERAPGPARGKRSLPSSTTTVGRKFTATVGRKFTATTRTRATIMTTEGTGTRAMTTATTTVMGCRNRQPRILIAGLGNLLLQDDGVGVHAVRALQGAPPPGVLVAEVGTAVLSALHLLEWADKILALDAIQAGEEPGTVYACGVEDAAAPGVQASLHELSLLNALRFLRRESPPEIVIFGVEPQVIDYGLELSPAVAAALPQLIRAVREMAAQWRNGGGGLRADRENIGLDTF